MFQRKRGQGLSLTTIVLAALSLLVLVVLVLIFTGRMGRFSIGVDESNTCDTFCESAGYSSSQVSSSGSCTTGENIGGARKFSDVKEGSVCCCVR